VPWQYWWRSEDAGAKEQGNRDPHMFQVLYRFGAIGDIRWQEAMMMQMVIMMIQEAMRVDECQRRYVTLELVQTS